MDNSVVSGPAGELAATPADDKAKALAWDAFRALNTDGWIPREMDRLLAKARLALVPVANPRVFLDAG